MRLRIHFVIGAVVIASIAAFAAIYLRFATQPSHLVGLAIGLAGFAVAAELLEYRMPQGGHGSIAIIPILSIALIAPSWQGVAVVAALEVVVQTIRRRQLAKFIFNIAQASLSTAVACVVYLIADGQSFANAGAFRSTVVENALPAILCLATVAVINSVAVSLAIAASTGRRFTEVWRQNTLGTLLYSLLAWPFACLLAWVTAHSGLVFAAAVAIPLLGVRQLYMTSIKLQQTNRELLELMVKAIEARDPYTSGHSRRVAEAATVIARGCGVSGKQLERVRIAALLHDVGKIHEDFAPILRKEGPLTKEEWEVMKTHPDKGADLVSTLSDLHDTVGPVRHHHENWDGTGYPAGIAGESIPLASRIITFADTIDALTTDRPYRPARTETEVRAELVRCRGVQFDPVICDIVLGHAVWSQLFRKVTPAQLRVIRKSEEVRARYGT
jgi:HD-GYP domain-containing protein (c-di-GMP phosphodiesterase class II)